MKNIKIYFFILCFCMSVTGYIPASARTEKVKTDIDWPAFMQKQDLIWETLPEYWYESAYMGNGMLGLMIYKEPGQNYIRFETGNCSVHDHKVYRPTNACRYTNVCDESKNLQGNGNKDVLFILAYQFEQLFIYHCLLPPLSNVFCI